MKTSFFRKIITFVSIFSIIAQSLTPYALLIPQAAYAQEETPVVEETTPPAETPVPTTQETQPTETVEATPTPSENLETTPVPTEDPSTASPTPTDNSSPPSNDQPATSDNSNSSSSNTTEEVQPSVTTVEESVTITPEQEGLQTTGAEELSLLVLDNVSAPSIDLEAVEESGSAVLTTDKPDYAPTDTALITGTNLLPNTEYLLKVWSDDEPPTGVSVQATSDENGVFAYAYQLDGTYRPNYSAELRDSERNIVAAVTFTDSPDVCQNDVEGANDEPGQKDLTRMCANYTNAPTNINVKWNWDETTWSGGNTGDGCSLYDIDNDGKVNFALCVTIGGSPAVFQTKTLYSCGNDKADRCTSPSSVIASSPATTCTVSTSSDDPFGTGTAFPNDTQANCTVTLSDVGGANSKLIDVCSYPSQQPNSDPSDCIVATALKTGKIEIKKTLSPSNDSGLFNLLIDNSPLVNDVGNNGTTGEQVVTAGNNTSNPINHTVAETAGTNTSLSNYSSTIVCKSNNGTGNTIAQSTNSGPLNVPVVDGDDIVCTITNTRINNGSITIIKDAVPNDGQDFAFTATGSGLSNFSLDDDADGTLSNTRTFSNLGAGTYSVSEGAVTGWTQTSATCTDGSPVSAIALSNGENVTCTFTNTRDTGTVVVHKDVQGPNGEDVTDAANFQVSLDAGTGQAISDNLTVTYNNVPVGNHTITESFINSGYTLYGISQTQGQPGNTGGLTINVTTGTNHVYVTNRQQSGTITVVKDVVNPDGSPVSDSHTFTVNLNPGGQSDSFAEGDNAIFTVNPGTYTASENDDLNYDELGCLTNTGKTDIVVGSGQQVIITCKNQQKKATINVTKDVLSPTNGTLSDNHAFTAQLNGGNDQSFSEATTAAYLVNPGNYSVTELPDNNYDYVSCIPDANQTAGDGAQLTVASNGQATVTCVNKQKNAQVTIVKDVRDPNGANVTDNTNFVVQRDGSGTDDKDFRENLNAVYTLAPGTYTFAELVTAGYTLNSISDDNDANVNNGTTVTLNSGENKTITFTNYQNAGSISGQKLNDVDGSLVTTNDQTNLTNWIIELYSCSSDFITCVLSATDTTDGTGYSFLNLVPGYYQVKEILQGGWTNLTSLFQNFTVNPGENETNANFVNFQNVSVTACKVEDADGGVQTTNDQTPVLGWTINLLTDGQISDTKATDGQGRVPGCYTWTNLEPNHTYSVQEVVPSDWTALSDTIKHFGTAQGGSQYNFTFVNFKNVSISGQKFNDLDGDGIKEAGENGLLGWTINLSGAATDSTLTDASGNYSFTNLGPGTYTLSETQQTNWNQTYPTLPTTHTTTVSSGVNVSGLDFGNQGQGSITVVKNVDTDGDGDIDTQGATDWTWDLNNGNQNYQTGSTQNVAAGTQTISEDQQANYHVTSVSCSNDNQQSRTASESIEITVTPGENVICTFTNTRDTGTITVIKDVVSVTEDSGLFNLQVDGNTEEENAGDGDSTEPITVVTGAHSVGETAGTETSLDNYVSSVSCVDEGGEGEVIASTEGNGTSLSEIQVNKDDDIVCTITNTKKGNIIVVKYNDENGDGELVGENPVLSGWTIRLDDSLVATTSGNGTVEFNNLTPGFYPISEDLQSGWEQTNIFCDEEIIRESLLLDQSEEVFGTFVSPGETVSCSILNHNLEPIITIEKINDAEGNKSPNDNVKYTITLTLDQKGGPAQNIKVVDLLPKGFVYNLGSWKVFLTNSEGTVDITETIDEPGYASPGTWNLKDGNPGDIFTLIYTAKIDGSQQTGTYFDNAWAVGNPVDSTDKVFAKALGDGDLDTSDANSEFVGTQVTLVNPNQAGVDYKATSTKEVLGASTFLPATGEDTLWVIIATLMLGLGFGTIVTGYRLKKKYE